MWKEGTGGIGMGVCGEVIGIQPYEYGGDKTSKSTKSVHSLTSL